MLGRLRMPINEVFQSFLQLTTNETRLPPGLRVPIPYTIKRDSKQLEGSLREFFDSRKGTPKDNDQLLLKDPTPGCRT